MYELKANHLHPSMKKCPKCNGDLKEWYRKKGKLIKTLDGEKYIVSHVYKCGEKKCQKIKITPEEEGRMVLKYCTLGLDITIKIGELRSNKNKTQIEVQEILKNKYNIKISQREVGNQEKTYLTLLNMAMKKEKSKEWLELKKLKGLVLAIDGIQPDIGNEVLFIIREIQTGYVLCSKMLDYVNTKEIKKLIEEVKNMPFKILGVVSDNDYSLRKAIEESLTDIPHQICQFHFLKQLGKKIKKEDGKLKKNGVRTIRAKKKS